MEIDNTRRWRKSSYSSGPNGMCVEVSAQVARTLVRDSKFPTGPVIEFSSGAWRSFITVAVPGDISRCDATQSTV